MLDAVASGLPIVVSERIGEASRVTGNGRFYQENDVSDLARQLATLESKEIRGALGLAGREKVLERFNWHAIAQAMSRDYETALKSRRG